MALLKDKDREFLTKEFQKLTEPRQAGLLYPGARMPLL